MVYCENKKCKHYCSYGECRYNIISINPDGFCADFDPKDAKGLDKIRSETLSRLAQSKLNQ